MSRWGGGPVRHDRAHVVGTAGAGCAGRGAGARGVLLRSVHFKACRPATCRASLTQGSRRRVGAAAPPVGQLTTCTGIPAPTQTGGWTNNSDLLLRRTFQAPAGVGSGSVQVRVDNDVIVYVNGVLLGTAPHEGCAGTNPPAPIAIPAGRLHAGDNLLALRARDRLDQRYIDAKVVANVDRFAVSLSPGSIPAGAQRTLTATIRNLGSATLQSVTLTPPAGLTGGGTLSGLNLTPGAMTTRTLDVVAACGGAGGTWTATASAPGTSPALSTATARWRPA